MAKDKKTQPELDAASAAPEVVTADNVAAKNVAEVPTAVVKKSGTALSILALLVALGVGGAGYYFGQQQVAALNHKIDSLAQVPQSNAANTVAPEVLQQLQSAGQNTQQQLAQVESLIQSKSQELSALQGQINQLAAKTQDRQPTDWLFSEADFLLNNALRKLTLDSDAETAVALLKAADETLNEVQSAQSQEIRGAIAQDIKTLSSLDTVDQNAIMQKLSQLANNVDELPLLNVNFAQETANDKPSDSLEDWQANAEKAATSFLNHFIRISPKHAADRKELLAPNQDIYLRENIRLRLQLAIMAVPRQQNELYKQSLEAVASWVRSYFDTNDEATQSFLKAVDELSEQSIYVDLPNSLQSLTLLNNYLKRTPITVQKVAIEADKDAAIAPAAAAQAPANDAAAAENAPAASDNNAPQAKE